MVQDPREQTLRWIQQLAPIERPSASSGERHAAEWIVEQLGDSATPARIEAEAAHGTHLPFVLPSALALLAGLLRSRPVAAVLAALATAAIADELEARRQTYNVVAEAGDPSGSRTIVLVAHHDAARPWRAAFGALVSAPPPLL